MYVLDHIEYEPRQSVPDRLRTGRQEVDDDVVQVEQTPLPREARGGTTRPPVRQVRVYKVARRALDESPLVLFPNDETKNVLEKLRPLIIRLYTYYLMSDDNCIRLVTVFHALDNPTWEARFISTG